MERSDDRIEFSEVIEIANCTGGTRIDPEPIKAVSGKWQLFEGNHRVHQFLYPFKLLLLMSEIVEGDLVAIAAEVPATSIFVVCPENVYSRPFVQEFAKRARGFWSTGKYLGSFVEVEFIDYKSRAKKLEPRYYTSPNILQREGRSRAGRTKASSGRNSMRSPLYDMLADQSSGASSIVVLLAEAGQGKSYMSQYLVSRLNKSSESLCILVEPTQWAKMPPHDERSIEKAIVNSFRAFDTPIPWLDGHESSFLKACLKARVLSIVFDGFDEFVMRYQITAAEALRSLAKIVEETGARVLITSRKAFWDTSFQGDEAARLLHDSQLVVWEMLPFGIENAQEYFKKIFDSGSSYDRSIRIFSDMTETSGLLAGRGFVLPLIADLAGHGGYLNEPIRVKGLYLLIEALCRREVVRHELEVTSWQQIDFMRLFAVEVARGEEPTSEILNLSIEICLPNLPNASRDRLLDKLEVHPLVRRRESDGLWFFQEKQVEIFLIANHIAVSHARDEDPKTIISNLALGPTLRQDLAMMVIDVIFQAGFSQFEERLKNLIASVTASAPADPEISDRSECYFAALLALMAVGRIAPVGHPRADRAGILCRICGNPITSMSFSDTIGSLDLRGVQFLECVFLNVSWDSCTFDGTTVFRKCKFIGGFEPINCKDFGLTIFENCLRDSEANKWIEVVRLQDGARRYTLDDLDLDLRAVVAKFSGRGGFGLRSVDVDNFGKGSISKSRHKNDIIEALLDFVLEEHNYAGGSGKGLSVRPDSEDDVKYYLVNNIFKGRLRLARERMILRLGLG